MKYLNSKIIIALVVVSLVAGGLLIRPKVHLTPVKNITNSNSSTDSSYAASTTSTSQTPVATTPNDSSLNQSLAQEEALAKQDEAEAEQYIKDAQSGQEALNSETPPPSYSSTSFTPPTITTSPPAVTCTAPGDLSTLQSQYVQADGQYNSFESDPQAYVDVAGVSASVVQAEEEQEQSQLETAVINAYNAYESAEAQVHC